MTLSKEDNSGMFYSFFSVLKNSFTCTHSMFLLEVSNKLATHTLNESEEFNGKITVSQRD